MIRMRIPLLLLILSLGVAGTVVKEPITGQYQAEAGGWSTAGGGPQQPPAAASRVTSITVGQALDGQLEAGDAQDQEGRYQDRFVFQGQAGQTVTLEVNSVEFDARLMVEDAAGQTVTQDNDGGIGTNARVVLTAPEAGPYTVVVSSSGPGETGSYQLKLHAGEVAQAHGGVKAELDEQYYRQALEHARRQGQLNREARLLRGLGDAKIVQAQDQQALEYYEQALKLAVQQQNQKEEARSRGGLGRAYATSGQPERAIEYFEHALAIARETKDREGEGTWLGNLGDAYRRLNQPERAREYYEQALAIARETKDRENEALWVGYLGMTYRNLGHYERARGYYEQALAIAREIKDRRSEGRWSGNLGNTCWDLGDYESAIGYYEQALAVARQIKDRRAEGAWLGNLGMAYYRLGQSERAIEYYEPALVIARETKNRWTEGYWLGNLGDAYRYRGQPEPAIGYYEQALAITREIKDRGNETRWLVDLGKVYERLAQPERAIEYYQQALANVREHKNRRNEARCLGYLGDAYRSLGQSERAREYYEQALAIAREDKHRDVELHWLAGLGQTYRRLGQLERARTTLQEALGTTPAVADPVEWANVHYELARIAQQQNQPERAEAEFEAARALLENLRHHVTVEALRTSFFATTHGFYHDYLTFLINRGQISRAIEVAEAARARSLLDLLAEAKVDVQLGIDPALKQRERASQTRISWIQSQLIQAHSPPSPDQSKIAQLEEALKKVAGEREQLEMEIRQKHPRYAELQYPTPLGLPAIQGLLDDQTALLEYALGQDSSFLFVISQDGSHSFRLPPASEITRLVHEIRVVLGHPPGPRLSWYQEFTTYVRAARKLGEILLSPAADVLAKKRHLLIAPDGALYYLPFESLLTQDMSPGSQLDYREVAYVLKQWTISYVPSASVLWSLRQRRPRAEDRIVAAAAKTFVAFGDPVYEPGAQTPDLRLQTSDLRLKGEGPGAKSQEPSRESQGPGTKDEGQRVNPVAERLRSVFEEAGRWELHPLEYSGREVADIARLYKPDEVAIYLGPTATEENVKGNEHLSTARRIHFATHGLISEKQPQYSGLVLSLPFKEDPGPKTQDPGPSTKDQEPRTKDTVEDGLLQVYEIFNLTLNADLVVLSACETGLGKEVKGEGLIGLTRAFLYAGTPSVAVSLWSVADRSTARLMVNFYEGLDRVKDKAEALRQAKLELMQSPRYAHPYYWAPFILVGERQ